MKKRVDLHTHSIASKDGGLNERQYARAFRKKGLDAIAITDHGTIEFAQYLAKQPGFEEKIIVGQEVRADEGEILGLFLEYPIEDGMSAQETVAAIAEQDGFVIIPHPAERFRHGMSIESMETILQDIDCIEVENGRKIRQQLPGLQLWASTNLCGGIASSDAHSYAGIGRTYTLMEDVPTSAGSLRSILKGKIRPVYEIPPITSFLAPKRNRIKHLIYTPRWK